MDTPDTPKKPQKTAYERRKVTEQRKKAEGLTKRNYYQTEKDIKTLKLVKDMLEDQSSGNITNDEAIAFIFEFYRRNSQK